LQKRRKIRKNKKRVQKRAQKSQIYFIMKEKFLIGAAIIIALVTTFMFGFLPLFDFLFLGFF